MPANNYRFELILHAYINPEQFLLVQHTKEMTEAGGIPCIIAVFYVREEAERYLAYLNNYFKIYEDNK